MTKRNLMPGTLDLLVLKTALKGGPQHGYGIARFVERTSGDELRLNQGTIYASLLRLQKRGWIRSQWGASENNRRAKFYKVTQLGRRQLSAATRQWEWFSNLMNRVLELAENAPDSQLGR